MDSEYDRKFEEMKKYIPFLESMIKRLENTGSSASKNPRQAQLDKIRSLRDLLLNKNKRMKMENLLKCEQVLVNLYAKVEKDPFAAKPIIENQPTTSQDKLDLETVRNKLKTVTKIQDGVETLPEIARANDIELNYTGSKEPALFQRRPNKSSKSPSRPVQRTPTKSRSPQSKRNYTRVLVSPDRSLSRWPTPAQSSEEPLFSRRSPPRTISPPPVGKKEKKKFKASKSRKTNDLNITLKVPQESINSLNTEDILSRIINCKDGDLDIDTLRELRTQIRNELKQTGKNDDISDLILKSYNIKSNPTRKTTGKNSKEDVEEGELSDSESEAIESIYGSLPLLDKKSSAVIKSKDNKDQQRKIQIRLVISDKAEANTSNKTVQPQVINLVSDLEMGSENESDKSKDIILIDSEKSPSPLTKSPVIKKTCETSKGEIKSDVTPLAMKMNTENVTECIILEDRELKDEQAASKQAVDIFSIDKTDELTLPEYFSNFMKSSVESKELPDSSVTKNAATSPVNINVQIQNKSNLQHKQNTEQAHDTAQQRHKFVANFYKPIEEQQSDMSVTSSSVTNNLQEEGNATEKNIQTETVQPTYVTFSGVTKNRPEKQNTDDNIKDVVKASSENKMFNKESTSVDKKKQDESQNIPLLNEPTIPPEAKANVLSEIDILQALKKEILSGGSMSVPGTEVDTPALHQPKLTKVANAEEVMPRKKISIEKYKEKVSTSIANQQRPLFFKKRRRGKKKGKNKKQSLKLTEKECERFNFPKRLSIEDDDDIIDISDDDFLSEGKEDSLGLDDIYGDLAPKSPDDEMLNQSTSPPIIIPTDPKSLEVNVVRNAGDVDMRVLLPTPMQPQHVPQSILSPLISPMGCGTPSLSPVCGIDRNLSNFYIDLTKTDADINRIDHLDPRKRRDISLSALNSPNPYATVNPVAKPKSFTNIAARAPNMTPSRTPNMTPSYMPSIPQLRTPNARTFEMTPSHQTIELEESITRKHVYAPAFPMSDNRERESSVSRDGPYWHMNKIEQRSRRGQWEESNKHVGPKWEDRDPWSNSSQNDGLYTPRYEDTYKSKYDKYNNRVGGNKYNTHDRRDSYSKVDCPTTPIPSFGWSECPSTPSSAFGRQEAPMTPNYPFSRSDCPTTPVHPFGRGDCPSTPSSGFGRNVDMASNHSYSRSECPPTPSHSFGRSECPPTPSHSFGRSECPQTPSHPFGRSDSIPYSGLDITNNANQKYSKDPRLNRRPAENESYEDYSHRDRKSKHYSGSEIPRNYEREKSMGKNDRDYGDRYAQQYDRNRRDVSIGPSTSREDVENNRLYSRNRESRYDEKYSKDYDDSVFRLNQRESSVGRTSGTRQCGEKARSRAPSVGRSTKEQSKDNISFQSETGRNFTINTSVKSTFLDFLPSGKPVQVFEYSFDARRQRAASVGRSLVRDSSVGRTLSNEPKAKDSTYSQDRSNKFKRASSVGRDMVKTAQTLQEVKADFQAYKSKLSTQKVDTRKENKNNSMVRSHQDAKNCFEVKSKHTVHRDSNKESKNIFTGQVPSRTRKNEETSYKDQKSAQNKQNYTPRKSNRDTRMRRDHPVQDKSRYKIDRRSESRDSRKSGIIYSNDNIAKGTIMGSGFGVKNYRIPKIKRVEPEVLEVKVKEVTESVEKSEVKKKTKGNDKKIKQDFKESTKLAETPIGKINSKNHIEMKNLSCIIDDESDTRVTRSKKKTDLNKSKNDVDDDVVVKTRKSKRSVIYDSDSDSLTGTEITKTNTQKPISKLNSPKKKANNSSKIISPVVATELQNDAIDESLRSNFEIDDMEIFSENLESNSVIDNINALIADLDNDLNTSKISNDSFTTDIEKIMEAINSPEGNSLGDISEVIEQDLNKSKKIHHMFADLGEKSQTISNSTPTIVIPAVSHSNAFDVSHNAGQLIDQAPVIKLSTTHLETSVSKPNLLDDDEVLQKVNEPILSEKSRNLSDTTPKHILPAVSIGTMIDISQNPSQLIDITKPPNIKQSGISLSKDMDIHPKELLDDQVLPKVNEPIVSTTDIENQETNEVKIQTAIEDVTSNDDRSTPDSTINKANLNKANEGLPDSTNDIHCELSSDVTSTNDSAKTSNKESEIQSTTQKDTFNSIGSLLSILQDKSKIKELLAMLGDQSSDNEKIKKKLEMLSEIVSDDEEEERQDGTKENLDTTTGKNLTEESGEINMTDKINKFEFVEKDQEEKNKEQSLTLNVENKAEIAADESVENNVSQSNSEAFGTTDVKVLADNASKTEADSLLHPDNEDCNTEKTSNRKTVNKTSNEVDNLHNSDNEDNNTEKTPHTKTFDKTSSKRISETDKLNYDDRSDAEDDEPLVKRVTKKNKGKKTSNKSKAALNKNTNKRNTRAVTAKTGVRKRGGELQKLQDDIKEMFMCDDILNATGIRMCRLAKMVSEKESVDSGPVVVLEKVKGTQNQEQTIKIRKKPGPKPKIKALEKKSKSSEVDTKMSKPKVVTKYKPGPKSKTKSRNDDPDPYEFDTDSVADTNTTKDSDNDSSDSENGSLSSSRSFGSSEVLADTKKKPRRKRRGIGGWQSGIIKSKNKKKKELKQETPKNDSPVVKPQKPITIPDLNCFTDKSYCFQKGVTTYDCRLCVYSGADIINHYKKQHPHNEIPLSRMDQKTAEIAIQQCEQKNFQTLSKISSDKYTCRFCYKEFANNRNVLETFFWHVVSNHTGEFKHLCSECVNVTRCPFNLDIPPPPKDGGQLIGYICKKCNFTQISLENLKTHVIVKHDDEETEVFTINLAVMSNKAMNAMMRRSEAEKSKGSRSLRSNRSVTDSSDIRDERSDVSESSGHNSECDQSESKTEEPEQNKKDTPEQKPIIDQLKTKLTFENDEPSDDTSVKMEQEDGIESSHFDITLDEKTTPANDSRRGNSDEIVDYPHFKLNYTESGAKEYVCCINGNDSHYKTSLLISMKKHIQSKHSEKWDGYCTLCKVIVTLQGVQSDFRDCLSHFLDKHMDDFPVLEKVVESAREEMETASLPESNILANTTDVLTCIPPTLASALPAAALSPALPARVATPPVERTASPSYIAVRPLADLISRDLAREIVQLEQETPITLPKIENVISLGNETTAPQSSPTYPNNAEPAQLPAKPFLYEEVQAEVMSKKHRVVLDAMMSKENLVRVFKCGGRFCSFTTDSPEDALLHASTHQRVGGEGALSCAYCNYDTSDNGIDLVMHVFKEHSRCQYCCPMCFYRAAASQLVGVHYAKAHSGAVKLRHVLRSTVAVSAPAPGHAAGLLTRDVAVQHFVCHHDEGACNFKTYTPGKFIEHLQQKHADATSHPCSLCPNASQSPAELVLHLRSHGLKLYQCTWCVHGANNEGELLAHAAAMHPDVQPQAYVRIITSKEGGKRVLPLAYLNKSKMPTEEVATNTSKENPVKEAERSIELEKLIAHTMLMNDPSTDQSFPDTEDAMEEPVEIPIEHLPDEHDSDEPLEPLLPDQNIPSEITTEPPAEENADSTETQNQPVIKAEPTVMLKDMPTDIICLDSDDESDAPAEAPATSNDEASNTANKTVPQKVTREVSRNSVTDEVSITKITEESTRSSEEPTQKANRQIENIIDLSDDDPAPSAATSDKIVLREVIYKCPFCLKVNKTVHSLRKHASKCPRAGPEFKCPHLECTHVATNITKLIYHYDNVHLNKASGINKRVLYCGICDVPLKNSTGAKLHLRYAHKVFHFVVAVTKDADGNEKHVLKDVSAVPGPVRISGRKTSTEVQRYQADPGGRPRKVSTESKKRYGPDDIDKLPINPILDSQVYCELCEFGTKVRLNMVRHLQQHAGNIPVPHTAPVNPVPHLETNEMHFDRMVNLASSSVASRAPDKPRADEPAVALKIPPSESSRYPKYVPERLRYTCGAQGCSYISVDMAMFRCHWETLHPREEQYRCVHCPPTQALTTSISLTAARILGHLRMHDVSLYACSICSYYHYRKHLVEKHISEVHKDGAVRVVREEYQPEPTASTQGAPTMDLKPWQCGLCDYSSMLRPKVVAHCWTEHQSKMQFKCAYCSFRSSAKENVVKHQTNAHPTMSEEIFYYFYREGSIPDEGGVPRWQQQRQKLRIDEREVKTEPEPEVVPETPKTPISITPAPVTIDLNIVKEEILEEPSDLELTLEDLFKKFGKLCEPDGIKFKCCLCSAVREHTREAMQSHLYEELNYRRWECVICSYKAFHINGLNDHMTSEHSRQLTQPRALPVDIHIEKWVQGVLNHQARAIMTNISNLSIQKIQSERATAPASPKKAESPKPISSASYSEMQKVFGGFGAPKNQKFACPKCEFTTKDETNMIKHLEDELNMIRWGCIYCSAKYLTYHEAQFHYKDAHTGQPGQPKECTRDPSLRSGWVKGLISSQRQFIKCISETNREPTPEKNTDDSDQNENSLLVALYDEPAHIDERPALAKRPAPAADSDEERLVIDEPPTKKPAVTTSSDRKCPYCDYNIQNSRYIREHILKEHYNMKPYKCCYCSFSGTRQAVTAHTNSNHPDQQQRIIIIEVPDSLPGEANCKGSEIVTMTTKRDKTEKPKDLAIAAVAKTTKRDVKDTEEVAKKVCLYCEKSVPETDTGSHTHGTEKAEFAKRGEVVVKCCKCLVLRLSITSLQEHFDACHPGEKVLDNYAYFKLQVDTREIHCCGHCYKKFKFLRDLKVHHSTTHTSLSLSFTSIPFSHNLHTEGDTDIGKRKADDTAGPSAKRVARKSTSKLPNSAVAKKSTTKLPHTLPDEESSYYGTKPLPLDHYKNVTLNVPIHNRVVEVDVERLSGFLKIDPKVVVKDYRS